MVNRPLLKYHGGKWNLGPWILSYFPPHTVYVEPFGGGGSILLQKERAHEEIYNDLDEEIVNLFRVVRDRGEELREKLELTPYSMAEFELSYLPTDDPLEKARRTVVRSFMGRNPSSATQKKGSFKDKQTKSYITISHVWQKYPDGLKSIIERLQGVIIDNRDAIELIKKHDSPETLFYVDPPYLSSTRDAGKDYRFEMTDEDHIELARVLNEVKGMVILSGYPSELYESLYKWGWVRKEKSTVADGHLPRTEVLWMKGISPSQSLFGDDF